MCGINKRYIYVSVEPTQVDSVMKYYWAIIVETDFGTYNEKSGYESKLDFALSQAYLAVK